MKNHTLIIIILLLFLAVAILGYFNQKLVADKIQSEENPEILITYQSEDVATISLEKIKSLGEENFKTTLRSSGALPEDHTYTGVPLKNVLNFLDETLLERGQQVIVKAIDGYVSVFYMKEVKDEKSVYLVYRQDGRPLKSRKEGGNGPLMIVAPKDRFGQRWCKYVIEVDIQ
jgi:DMSO/TMAO reductase YedYZ molybdopterin-dependent catalytic subunit